METKFEKAFLKGIRKHASIKKEIERKVRQIIDHPVELGDPLKQNWRGFYSCAVRRNFIIIYLYCWACRKKGDAPFVACADCADTPDETIKFVLVASHDEAYGIK